MEYSREEIVKYFYETKRKLGRVPKVKEFKLISPVRRNWGKYNLKKVGKDVPLVKMVRLWEDDEENVSRDRIY